MAHEIAISLGGLQCHNRLWFEIHQPLKKPIEPSIPILQGRAFDEAVQRLTLRDQGARSLPTALLLLSRPQIKAAEGTASCE